MPFIKRCRRGPLQKQGRGSRLGSLCVCLLLQYLLQICSRGAHYTSILALPYPGDAVDVALVVFGLVVGHVEVRQVATCSDAQW